VEGYVESTAIGLVAGINAARRIVGRVAVAVPDTTAHGSLIRHITAPAKNFQPSNINFGLFPPVNSGKRKDLRKKMLVERAVKDWEEYLVRVQQ
jgi:methylenetetrahydrofolate--tRNA-(uracil-5-)-methyltransferase